MTDAEPILVGRDPGELELNDPSIPIWVRVQDAAMLLWRDNPKLHDLGMLSESVVTHGYKSPARFSPHLYRMGQPFEDKVALGALETGNGRTEAISMMERGGDVDLPRGLGKDGSTGEWYMMIFIGTDAVSMAMAQAYAVDDNL